MHTIFARICARPAVLVTAILISVAAPPVNAQQSDDGISHGLLSAELLATVDANAVAEYRCPGSDQCQVRCSTANHRDIVEYRQVQRLEIGQGEKAWILSATWIDPAGKGHRATAQLTAPVSCITDDLLLEDTRQMVDGQLLEPLDREVIFRVEPSPR